MNAILAVGRVVGGSVHLLVTPPALLMPAVEAEPLPWESLVCAPDGTLQAMIDLADDDTHWWESEPSEYEEDMLDRLFWSRGEW